MARITKEIAGKILGEVPGQQARNLLSTGGE
jgi:hypothetical protein